MYLYNTDATMDDALAVGIDKVARAISSGSDAPGTILSQCFAEMLRYYRSADVIIAKGQGNYESLDAEPGNIFFLLRVKCPVLAVLLGVQVGGAVLYSTALEVIGQEVTDGVREVCLS